MYEIWSEVGGQRANLNGRSTTITYEGFDDTMRIIPLCIFRGIVDSKVNDRRLPFHDVVPEQGKQVSMNN